MRHCRSLAALLLLALAGEVEAQVEACGIGDESCYQHAFENACSVATATIPSCNGYIAQLAGRAGEGDKFARLYRGNAFSWMGLFLSDPEDDGNGYLARASAIYRELTTNDPAFAEAWIGLAAVLKSDSERLQALRQGVMAKPLPAYTMLFVSALKKSGKPEDLLEAAEAAERAYSQPGKQKVWKLAADAIDLYEKAGSPGNAQQLRSRVRPSVNADAAPAEITRTTAASPEYAWTQLQAVCDADVIRAIRADACIGSLEGMALALGKVSNRASAQEAANAVARLMGELSGADAALKQADPEWRKRLLRLFDGLASQGFASAATWMARASIETVPRRRIQALEQALAFAPENAAILSELGFEYDSQKRWDDAIRVYRKARDNTRDDVTRRMLDHNIQVDEKRKAEASGSPDDANGDL